MLAVFGTAAFAYRERTTTTAAAAAAAAPADDVDHRTTALAGCRSQEGLLPLVSPTASCLCSLLVRVCLLPCITAYHVHQISCCAAVLLAVGSLIPALLLAVVFVDYSGGAHFCFF